MIDRALSASDAIAELEDFDDDFEEELEDGAEDADELENDVDEDDDEEEHEDTDSLDPDEEEVENASEEDSEDDDDEDGTEETSAQPTVEVPTHLSDIERAEFTKLQPEAQRIVARLAKTGEAKNTQKSQEIANRQKFLEARIQHLDAVTSEAEAAVAEWEELDWADLAEKVSAEEYNRYRAQYEKDTKRLSDLQSKKDEQTKASDLERQERVRLHQEEQLQVMPSVFPELLDQSKAPELLKDISKALLDAGTTRENLEFATAGQLKLAHDALQWRKAQAKKATLRPKSDAKTKAKRVKAKPKASSSRKTGRRSEAFDKNPSRRNAMAAIMDFD